MYLHFLNIDCKVSTILPHPNFVMAKSSADELSEFGLPIDPLTIVEEDPADIEAADRAFFEDGKVLVSDPRSTRRYAVDAGAVRHINKAEELRTLKHPEKSPDAFYASLAIVQNGQATTPQQLAELLRNQQYGLCDLQISPTAFEELGRN